jgi:site-specific recombinase XerD
LRQTLFNFVKSTSDPSFVNPCDSAVLKKTFRHAKGRQWTILEKDAVDEIIFRTENPRDRLILELMAGGGIRIGEVLKLRMMDVEDCKLYRCTADCQAGRQKESGSKSAPMISNDMLQRMQAVQERQSISRQSK